MQRFRLVSTDAVAQGSVLYDDVCDRAGNVLLPRGTVLNGAQIRALVRRGVGAVQVVAGGAEQDTAGHDAVRARLAWLCRHAGDGRANETLRAIVERYRTEPSE
jgi:hypothetical protein